MNEQEDFFTKDHGRLLDIAVLSKNISWVVLIVYILSAVTLIFPYGSPYNSIGHENQIQFGLWSDVYANPFDGFNLVISMAAKVLQGVVYFLVLKGVSLGLNMIVETDLNYRERTKEKNMVLK